MKRLKSWLFFTAAVATVQMAAPPVLACAACFGKSDSSLARGMNMGIFALLLVITSVLCGVAGFFVYVARRTAHLEQTTAPFAEKLSQQTNA